MGDSGNNGAPAPTAMTALFACPFGRRLWRVRGEPFGAGSSVVPVRQPRVIRHPPVWRRSVGASSFTTEPQPCRPLHKIPNAPRSASRPSPPKIPRPEPVDGHRAPVPGPRWQSLDLPEDRPCRPVRRRLRDPERARAQGPCLLVCLTANDQHACVGNEELSGALWAIDSQVDEARALSQWLWELSAPRGQTEGTWS